MRTPTCLVRALLALVACTLAIGADEPTPSAYLDAALDIMEQNSINRETIDWPAFRQRAHERIAGAKTIRDVHTPLRAILKELGDRHSFLRTPPPPPPVARGEMKGDFAYVSMPTYPGGTPQANTAFADTLQKIIADLDARQPKGWILDLRENSGGNMWPMLAGIGPLLGDGENGRFLTHGETTIWWYRDGGASFGDNPVITQVSGPPYQLRTPGAPVAVLTGGRTSSSGEAMVVAFKGRPATRFFGVPTSGQSTANRGMRLSDGATIYLTTGTYVDRTGQIYGDAIDPDELIPSTPDSPDDPVLTAALTWLQGQN